MTSAPGVTGVAWRDDYDEERGVKLGEGTYGTVYRGRSKATGELVAIKHVALDVADETYDEDLAFVRREFDLLTQLATHAHVVGLLGVYQTRRRVRIVLEHCDTTLREWIRSRSPMGVGDVWATFRQLLCGVAHCHAHGVAHRDLTPKNVLLKGGTVKLGDFGMGRRMAGISGAGAGAWLTPEVVTLWYRPPELLLGATTYGVEIDVWSCGCLLSEMITGLPLFPGESEIEMLFLIFRARGTPSTASRLCHLSCFRRDTFPQWSRAAAKERLREGHADAAIDAAGVELLEGLLACDPDARPTAQAALDAARLAEAEAPAPAPAEAEVEAAEAETAEAVETAEAADGATAAETAAEAGGSEAVECV